MEFTVRASRIFLYYNFIHHIIPSIVIVNFARSILSFHYIRSLNRWFDTFDKYDVIAFKLPATTTKKSQTTYCPINKLKKRKRLKQSNSLCCTCHTSICFALPSCVLLWLQLYSIIFFGLKSCVLLSIAFNAFVFWFAHELRHVHTAHGVSHRAKVKEEKKRANDPKKCFCCGCCRCKCCCDYLYP